MNLAAPFALTRACLPLLAAACSSPDPVYYTVATRPGPVLPAGPKVIMLKDISLASYLDRREIVRSSEGYKLDVRSNDWWGQPLGGMLGKKGEAKEWNRRYKYS